MNYLITLGISALMTLASAFGLYNYAPLSVFETQSLKLGSTITTINGGDTISSSRSVINTNFTNLNNGKIENSTTSVAAITTLANLTETGVLASSTYRGSKIQPAYGGTGTSSPTGLLWGDGSNLFSVASGTSGDFLQSNGSSAPAFAAAQTDQTAGYVWSGTHTFGSLVNLNATTNATGTIYAKNLNASSTSANPIVLNGVSYNTPLTQGASSTVFMNNGSGTLISDYPQGSLLYATTTASAKGSATSTTFAAFNNLHFDIYLPNTQQYNPLDIQFNADDGANYSSEFDAWGNGIRESWIGQPHVRIKDDAATTTSAYISIDISNYASRPKIIKTEILTTPAGTTVPKRREAQGVWNNTSSQITLFGINTFGAGALLPAGTEIRVYGRN